MKKRILITGVAGFIGGYLADRYLSEGYEVHGLYQSSTTSPHKGVIHHVADLKDFDDVKVILANIEPQFIIHLAARTEVEKSFYDPIDFQFVNYNATVNLIEASKDLPGFELFVFASTMETYGQVPKSEWRPFTEDTIQYPNAPYAVAKKACELYLEYAKRAYNFPYCALRQTNSYGRWDNKFFVVEQIITQMFENDKEINLGYREPWRNFLFIDDLIDLYSIILKNVDLSRGEVFCTGPDNALQISDLADRIAKKIGWKGVINWNTKPKRVGEIYYLNSTAAKAKSILGWEPKVSLDEGLDRTIKMWKPKL